MYVRHKILVLGAVFIVVQEAETSDRIGCDKGSQISHEMFVIHEIHFLRIEESPGFE